MADATYTIRLDALEVRMGLGIHAEERAGPQRVLVAVAMTCAYPDPPGDRIDAVVDYDRVREGIHAIAASGHFMLQEVFCERVAALCLTDPRVIEVTVRSTKPDIYPDAQIGCEITRGEREMTLSLYSAVVPNYIQILGAVAGLLDKAEAHCGDTGADPDDLLTARLADDMLPFGYQVKSCAAHSIGAIEGVRAGVFSPDMTPWPTDIAGLRAAITDALAKIEALSPDEINGFVGQDMRFAFGEMNMPFTAEDFLLSFSQPNFYFHATTAYDILRWKGVKLGKRDFMGRPRLKV